MRLFLVGVIGGGVGGGCGGGGWGGAGDGGFVAFAGPVLAGDEFEFGGFDVFEVAGEGLVFVLGGG